MLVSVAEFNLNACDSVSEITLEMGPATLSKNFDAALKLHALEQLVLPL